jgi:toluene monooxygenase system protein E
VGLRKLTGQKTYWHLLDAKRRPSVYEIASSRLHYYPALGFAVDTPIQTWYEKYQFGSAFQGIDLEAFADPRKTTYTSYTRLQSERETYLNGVLDAASSADDAALGTSWLQPLARVFAPLRYPCHALMMMAAYLASMAPGSRVTIAAAFQAADEIRRVHGLARRLHQLRRAHPGLGQDARAVWLEDSAWQGLRRIIERTLVVYDWSECFVTVNLALKPTFDHLFVHALAACARGSADTATAQLLGSMEQDARWHGAWSRELLRVVLEQAPSCRTAVLDWLRRYTPELDDAIAPIAAIVDGVIDTREDAQGAPPGKAALGAARARADYLAGCGLEIGQRR